MAQCGDEIANTHWPECVEYRFVGALGMGGKVWAGRHDGRVYVTCYPENETPERKAMIERANERLAVEARPQHVF